MLVFVSIVLVMLATLTPNSSGKIQKCSDINNAFFLLEWQNHDWPQGYKDVIQNILLFFPLGLSMSWFLRLLSNKKIVPLLCAVSCTCFAISYTVEAGQLLFLPTRCAALNDVFSNTLGGALGGFLFFFPRSFILAWLAFSFIVSVPLQQRTSISNWDRGYRLLIGNEKTGNRPWQGVVSKIFITEKAASSREIQAVLEGGNIQSTFGRSLLADFQGTPPDSLHDQTGKAPSLRWKGISKLTNIDGTMVTGRQWLISKDPPHNITDPIKKTGQFTVGLTVKTLFPSQYGPARIISFSENPGRRNLTVGQEGNDLIIRIRTPLTGLNGASPQFCIPDVFAATEKQTIIASYDGATMRVYINNERDAYCFDLSPGAAGLSFFVKIQSGYLQFYKILYLFLVFFPSGFYLVIQQGGIRNLHRPSLRWLILGGSLPPLLLEGILMYVSGKNMRYDSIFIAMGFIASPILMTILLRKFLHLPPCHQILDP